jgi:hypothetical protein
MRDLIIKICDCLCPAKNKKSIGFAFGLPVTKEKMPATVSITTEQKVPVKLNITTETGKPAKVDGKPTWEIITGNATVNVAEDGLSAEVVSSDDPGDTQILVKADANLGEGIEEISDILEVSVIGASAKNMGLQVGTPVPKESTP